MLSRNTIGLLLLTFGLFLAISFLWVHPVAAEGGVNDPNGVVDPNSTVDPNEGEDPGQGTDPNSVVDPNEGEDPNDPGQVIDPNDTVDPNDIVDPNGTVDPNDIVDPNGTVDPNCTDPNDIVDPNAGVDPNEPPEPNLPYMYVDAGGPYQGTVGVPIEFDGSNSYIYDGNEIDIYYWDWGLDRHFESSCFPQQEHTWHCAFDGYIRLYVFHPDGHVDWDKAYVSVEGSETALLIEVSANADLHVRDIRGRHVGVDYRTGVYELEVPDVEVFAMDAEGEEIPFTDDLVLGDISQLVGFPPYDGGPYKIWLVGLEDGPFTMTVYAFQDGVSKALRRYTGEIFAGETISMDISATCVDDELTMTTEELSYDPERP